MNDIVDEAVDKAMSDAVMEYEKLLQKEREKKQFWKQAAVTQTLVFAASIFTGIVVYRVSRSGAD